MLSVILNVLVALLVAATFGGGTALFVIARQDDSKAGRILGVVVALVSLSVALYLTWGAHWL